MSGAVLSEQAKLTYEDYVLLPDDGVLLTGRIGRL